uniref:Uncharacterized protein n=1 Tax=Anguilla anguilla TaxID=7936 RepID=A0A0E9RFG1_ANGAN
MSNLDENVPLSICSAVLALALLTMKISVSLLTFYRCFK